jgi:maltooligosyltrehalose trehalohydrolase
MSSFDYAFGAQLLAPGRTRFRLWAPGISGLGLEIAGRPPQAMMPLADGWFEAEAACGAGARYRYRIDGGLAVPDPASRAQDGDVHDASIVCDPYSFRWQYPEWAGRPWHEAVLYELHVGVAGGFAGVLRRLPELAELGVTALELMPVADCPGPRNWGYDGVLPYAPDAAYGTPDQLKAVVDAAHGLGMMVLLDVVYNHFGPDGNYLHAYAGSFFRSDVATPWGRAIDFRNRWVRDFFTENALYWLLEFRFDGLRLDAVHAITEQDWLPEMAQRVRAALPPGRQAHLVLENDHNRACLLEPGSGGGFDAQWNDDLHHALHVLLTGEHEGYYAAYADQPADLLARGLAEGFIYQGEPFGPSGRARGEPSAHLPPTAFVAFLQNHDQIGNRALGERLATLAEHDALRAAMALLLLSPQIPLLFMGEEVAAAQPFLYFTSYPDPQLAEAIRSGRRAEFARFSAFSDPAARERIPDPNARQTFLDSIPQPRTQDAWPWREWIKALLAIRREHIVPRLAGARALGAEALGTAAVRARWRMADGALLTVMLNLAGRPVALMPDYILALAAATSLYATEGAAGAVVGGELPAHAFIALLEVAP